MGVASRGYESNSLTLAKIELMCEGLVHDLLMIRRYGGVRLHLHSVFQRKPEVGVVRRC